MELKEFATLVKQEEGLKLEKNSKGYNWEIKLVGEVNLTMIARLEVINNNLNSKFNNLNLKQEEK